MYKKEFEALLNSSKFPNYFLVFGSDDYQIDEYSAEILELYGKDESTQIYYDEYDFSVAKSVLLEPNLFSSNSVLHIKRDSKIPKKELEVLVNACKKNNDCKFLFEFYEGDMKIALESTKVFGQNFVRFFAPSNPNEAVSLLAKKAQKLHLDITTSALYQIYSIHNENLYLSATELNKLSNLGKKIDEQMVKDLVFGLSPVSFDEIFNKLIELKDFKDDFFLCFESANFNEISFLNSIYLSLFRLFKIHSYVKSNGTFDIKAAIGYAPPPNIAKFLQTQALKLSLNTFKELFMFLNGVEFELKTDSNLEKKYFLLSSLIKFQEIIYINSKN